MNIRRNAILAASSLALVALGGAMIRARTAQPQRAAAAGSRTIETSRSVVPRQPGVRQPYHLPAGLRGGMHLEPVVAVQDPDGSVTVRGSADVVDRRPVRHVYAWLLRVFDNQGKLVNEHHYPLMDIHAGGESASPGFVDNFDLAPGDYTLELSFYGIPPGFDRSVWKPGADIKRTAGITVVGSVKLTVQ